MGVFSIITIMAIGNATEEYINSQFEKIGANVLTVGYKNMNVDSDEMLYLKDIETVKRAAPEIKNVTLIFSIGEHCELIQNKKCFGVWNHGPVQGHYAYGDGCGKIFH